MMMVMMINLQREGVGWGGYSTTFLEPGGEEELLEIIIPINNN